MLPTIQFGQRNDLGRQFQPREKLLNVKDTLERINTILNTLGPQESYIGPNGTCNGLFRDTNLQVVPSKDVQAQKIATLRNLNGNIAACQNVLRELAPIYPEEVRFLATTALLTNGRVTVLLKKNETVTQSFFF